MTDQSLSFDRMRGMLMRAAELRDSEQQQIFDSLDEIHARLAGLDAIGTVRKRLSEMPDRTEVGVLAERLDEAVAKLDAQDSVLAAVVRALEVLPDKLGRPIAALDGRLDGMAGRLEGVSGRMDGLDDRLAGLHKRLDELDTRLDRHEMRLDALPTTVGGPVKEKIDGVERMVREQLTGAVKSFDETGDGIRNLLGDSTVGLHRRLEDLGARPAVDPARVEAIAAQLEEVAGRPSVDPAEVGSQLAELAARLEALAARPVAEQSQVERLASRVAELAGRPVADPGHVDGLATRLDDLVARPAVDPAAVIGQLDALAARLDALAARLDGLDAVLGERPDAAVLQGLVTRANEESERRTAGHLDEAMATFAEIIMGGRGPSLAPPPAPPRAATRRTSRSKATAPSANGHGDPVDA
jgi:hypothetical protein